MSAHPANTPSTDPVTGHRAALRDTLDHLLGLNAVALPWSALGLLRRMRTGCAQWLAHSTRSTTQAPHVRAHTDQVVLLHDLVDRHTRAWDGTTRLDDDEDTRTALALAVTRLMMDLRDHATDIHPELRVRHLHSGAFIAAARRMVDIQGYYLPPAHTQPPRVYDEILGLH